jgi:hypothetical protein
MKVKYTSKHKDFTKTSKQALAELWWGHVAVWQCGCAAQFNPKLM